MSIITTCLDMHPDDGLRSEIAALQAQADAEGVSAAVRHGLKKRIAQKHALLRRDSLPPGL